MLFQMKASCLIFEKNYSFKVVEEFTLSFGYTISLTFLAPE